MSSLPSKWNKKYPTILLTCQGYRRFNNSCHKSRAKEKCFRKDPITPFAGTEESVYCGRNLRHQSVTQRESKIHVVRDSYTLTSNDGL